jgi:hypothetical protein
MTEGDMGARRYRDDERAGSLALLAANGGNLHRTARDLGIPRRTLEHWAKGTAHPEAAQDCAPKKGALAECVRDALYAGLGVLPGKLAELDGYKLTIALATLIDKLRLLEDKPTSVSKLDISAMTDEELARAIEAEERAIAALKAAEAPAPPAGTGGPAEEGG